MLKKTCMIKPGLQQTWISFVLIRVYDRLL